MNCECCDRDLQANYCSGCGHYVCSVCIDQYGHLKDGEHWVRGKDRFVCLFHFVGWNCLSLGFHICITAPNFELHLPFGFVLIGWIPDRYNLDKYL